VSVSVATWRGGPCSRGSSAEMQRKRVCGTTRRVDRVLGEHRRGVAGGIDTSMGVVQCGLGLGRGAILPSSRYIDKILMIILSLFSLSFCVSTLYYHVVLELLVTLTC
jgi:hypothetical protein